MKQCASQGDDFGTIQVIFDGVDMKYDLATNRILTDFSISQLPKIIYFNHQTVLLEG
jgi:hypothetical protein